MAKPKIGKKAPEVELTNEKGQSLNLKDFKGKKIILYFYPKDNTPGCTQESCDFRDNKTKFSRRGAVIIGVSPDSEASHEKFKSKYNLPFELLSDPDKKAAKAYGVWKEKSMYGKKYMGIERSTFVIDEKGKLIHEFRKVKVKNHIEELLELI